MTKACVSVRGPARVSVSSEAKRVSLLLLIGLFAGAASCGSEDAKWVSIRKPPKMAPEDAGSHCPPFDTTYVEGHKACASDDDCEVIPVRWKCCTETLVGIASELRADFDACDPSRPGEPPPECTCDSELVRAEDQRLSTLADHADTEVVCLAGRCQTRVTARSCAELGSCAKGELCVGYQSAKPGVAVEHQCVFNPCSDLLSCECAQDVCTNLSEQERSCAIDDVVDSDVFCKIVRR